MNADCSRSTHKRHDIRNNVLDLVRQGSAVGIAKNNAIGTVHHCRFENTKCEFRVGFVPIEEMFSIEEHPQTFGLQEGDRFSHHCDAFVERGPKCFGDVKVPALTNDAYRRCSGANERRKCGIDIDLASRAASGTKRNEFGIGQLQL